MSDVVVIDYGAGNTRSVRAALTRLGLTTTLSADPNAIADAERVVLPGVGSARAAMAHLNATGAAQSLRDRFQANGMILGICLGLQLACEHSEEDGGVDTLGLVAGTVRRLRTDRVPRLGWARVEPWGESYYFAHGYSCDSPSTVATSEGACAAIRSGSFTGVQFHPEKSGPAGLNFLATCLTPA